MTSNDNTKVRILVSSTSGCGTTTNRRKVVRDIDTETVPVVKNQTVAQSTRITEVSVQEARVFVLQNFHQDRINNNPTTRLVHVLLVQQTAHTVNQHNRRDVCGRQSRSTRKTS